MSNKEPTLLQPCSLQRWNVGDALPGGKAGLSTMGVIGEGKEVHSLDTARRSHTRRVGAVIGDIYRPLDLCLRGSQSSLQMFAPAPACSIKSQCLLERGLFHWTIKRRTVAW